jgi:hypothetical protein
VTSVISDPGEMSVLGAGPWVGGEKRYPCRTIHMALGAVGRPTLRATGSVTSAGVARNGPAAGPPPTVSASLTASALVWVGVWLAGSVRTTHPICGVQPIAAQAEAGLELATTGEDVDPDFDLGAGADPLLVQPVASTIRMSGTPTAIRRMTLRRITTDNGCAAWLGHVPENAGSR